MHEGKLLCLVHKPYNSFHSTHRNIWAVPGGGLEEQESLIDGVKREILEETGVEGEIGELLYIQQYSLEERNTDHLEFFFHIKNGEDFLNIDISSTTHGEQEIEKIEFVDPTTIDLWPKFLMTEPITEKISNKSPVTIFSYLSK